MRDYCCKLLVMLFKNGKELTHIICTCMWCVSCERKKKQVMKSKNTDQRDTFPIVVVVLLLLNVMIVNYDLFIVSVFFLIFLYWVLGHFDGKLLHCGLDRYPVHFIFLRKMRYYNELWIFEHRRIFFLCNFFV